MTIILRILAVTAIVLSLFPLAWTAKGGSLTHQDQLIWIITSDIWALAYFEATFRKRK